MATVKFEQLFGVEGSYNAGHREAFLQKIYRAAGGDLSETTKDQLDGVLAGEYDVKFVECILKQFDQHGRRIPFQGFKSEVLDANYSFYLRQSEIKQAAGLVRITKHLTGGEAFISPEDFKKRSDAVLAALAGDKRTVDIAKGVYLPIALPKMDITAETYGSILDEKILQAVESAYKEQFPQRAFNNWRKVSLAGKVKIVKSSRHENFLDAINSGPVVLVLFPTALQGFSIWADIEQMSDLPDQLLLAGAIELATGLVGYTAEIARDYRTPGYDCAALRWSADVSLRFKADDENLVFDNRDPRAYGSYSGGLVALG